MSIVSISAFNNYLGNFEDGEDMLTLKKSILASAEEVVINYVGYNPVSHLVEEEFHMCTGHSRVSLNEAHPQYLHEVLMNGHDITDFCCIHNGGIHCRGLQRGSEIQVCYTAGWDKKDLPEVFTNTILRIASLMFAETNGAIGLTGRTSPDGSKSYISYTNYNKYLSNLDSYKRRFF